MVYCGGRYGHFQQIYFDYQVVVGYLGELRFFEANHNIEIKGRAIER